MIMLTDFEIDYLSTMGVNLVIVNGPGGRQIRGGDEQYAAILASPNLTVYKDLCSEELAEFSEQKIESKLKRHTSKRYQLKREQANLFKGRGYTDVDDFPLLKREAVERGVSARALADNIITRSNQDSESLTKMELARVKLKRDINTLTTIQDIYTQKRKYLANVEAE